MFGKLKNNDAYMNISFSFLDFLKRFGIVIGMVLILVILNFINNNLFTIRNISSILNSSSFLVVMSLGLMMTMSVKGVDLSVAQVADASAVIAAMLLISGQPFWIAILGTLLFGLIIGTINSLVISYLGVPAIIGTMGMMFIVRSFELTLTKGAQPQILYTLPVNITKHFFFIGQGYLGPIPFLLILSALIIVVMYFIKERSILGRHMDAIQGNVRASFISSINIRKVFGSTYLFCSLLAAIAGIMIASRAGLASPKGVESYLNDCFVAVFLGTLLSRVNRFNVMGTLVGTLFIGFVNNFLTLQGLGNAPKNILNGALIIFAVSINVIQNRRK